MYFFIISSELSVEPSLIAIISMLLFSFFSMDSIHFSKCMLALYIGTIMLNLHNLITPHLLLFF